VKLIGVRAEVGGMYAIASIKEDYLGCVCLPPADFSEPAANLFTRCLQAS
jgi:hypothetical protein